jgi:phosphoglycolate phosphatase-like HAD superfamily hydrolase
MWKHLCNYITLHKFTMLSFKGKKIIVFDLDGTIVNLNANWKILRDILIKKYLNIYQETHEVKHISKLLRKIVEKNDEKVLEEFFDIIRNFELANLKNLVLIEETILFINNRQLFGVPKDAKFAILSLNTRKTIFRALEIAKISDKIDLIVGREDLRNWKPEPEGLLKIQAYFHVKKEEMVFIGDLDNDLLTGQNAGIDAFLVKEIVEMVHNYNK